MDLRNSEGYKLEKLREAPESREKQKAKSKQKQKQETDDQENGESREKLRKTMSHEET